jgi:hypothetical protein
MTLQPNFSPANISETPRQNNHGTGRYRLWEDDLIRLVEVVSIKCKITILGFGLLPLLPAGVFKKQPP